MRSPSGGQGGGWGQPPQSNYNSRPMNRYGGGHNDMAQGYGSYQVRVYTELLHSCLLQWVRTQDPIIDCLNYLEIMNGSIIV